MQTLVHSLRVDAAYGFIENGLIPVLAKAVEGYTLQDMEFFWHVFYECVKVSGDFRRAVLACRNWQQLHNKNRQYSMGVNYCLMKDEKQQLVSLDSIKQEVTQPEWAAENELSRTFQIAILHMALLSKPESRQRFELNKLLLRRAGELLMVDDLKKTKAVETVEGWAFGQPYFRFDDILSDMLASIS
ncbi:MAG: hypothetical protein JST59_01400 [Actinobacteria bacterium]|nr:hypothetical protein [Actinomycetota bacterium]